MARRLALAIVSVLLIGARGPVEVPLGDLVLRVEAMSKRPLGHGRFERTFAATLHNPTAVDLGEVVVDAASASTSVQVIEGRLRFRSLRAGETRTADALLLVQRRGGRSSAELTYTISSAAPALLTSVPADGAAAVARTDWPVLHFAARPSDEARRGFSFTCDSVAVSIAVHALDPGSLLLNPAPELPPATSCRVGWIGPGDRVHALGFATAEAGAEALVHYDRAIRRRLAPLPDDYFTTPDPASRTGLRVQIPVPAVDSGSQVLFRAVLERTSDFDGFSPHGSIVVRLSDVPDSSRVPRNAAESLDPLSPIVLLDLSPGSTSHGERVGFAAKVRSDQVGAGPLEHVLFVFPAVNLAPGGRYGLVITRRLLVDASRPFGPSVYSAAAFAAPEPGEHGSLARVRPLAEDVLAAAASAELPIPREDVALALRFTAHTNDTIPLAPLAMRSQLEALPPPAFTIDDVSPGFGHVAAIVHGTFESPDWRDGSGNLSRDANGLPQVQSVGSIPFVLALPDRPLGGAPLVIYGHGRPGSAENEVPFFAEVGLAEAGFAVLGITEPLDREVGQNTGLQAQDILLHLLIHKQVPGFWLEAVGEKLALLRLVPELADLDLLPLGAPDGSPDLDVGAPLSYLGISWGGITGQTLLPYAPEIRAANLVAGCGRFTELAIHQEGLRGFSLIAQVGQVFPNVLASELWAGFHAFQLIYDPQEAQAHAAFLYRQPLGVAGTTRKASILWTEGLGDTFAPANASRASAHTIGIPLVAPFQESTPVLDEVASPVEGNVDAATTGGLFQYVPQGYPGLPPTPGCEFEPEGHFCAQTNPAAVRQRVRFFESALDGEAAVIGDPFAEE